MTKKEEYIALKNMGYEEGKIYFVTIFYEYLYSFDIDLNDINGEMLIKMLTEESEGDMAVYPLPDFIEAFNDESIGIFSYILSFTISENDGIKIEHGHYTI